VSKINEIKCTFCEFCYSVVITTEYPRVVLVDIIYAHEFRNELSPGELSVTTYSSNKDEFLFGDLTGYIKQVLLVEIT
jgi:hypothetical protein